MKTKSYFLMRIFAVILSIWLIIIIADASPQHGKKAAQNLKRIQEQAEAAKKKQKSSPPPASTSPPTSEEGVVDGSTDGTPGDSNPPNAQAPARSLAPPTSLRRNTAEKQISPPSPSPTPVRQQSSAPLPNPQPTPARVFVVAPPPRTMTITIVTPRPAPATPVSFSIATEHVPTRSSIYIPTTTDPSPPTQSMAPTPTAPKFDYQRSNLAQTDAQVIFADGNQLNGQKLAETMYCYFDAISITSNDPDAAAFNASALSVAQGNANLINIKDQAALGGYIDAKLTRATQNSCQGILWDLHDFRSYRSLVDDNSLSDEALLNYVNFLRSKTTGANLKFGIQHPGYISSQLASVLDYAASINCEAAQQCESLTQLGAITIYAVEMNSQPNPEVCARFNQLKIPVIFREHTFSGAQKPQIC